MKPLKTGVDVRRVREGRVMFETVKEMPGQFNVGDWVKTKQKGAKGSPEKDWIKVGQIVDKTKDFIVVKGLAYRETYTYTQIALNHVKILKITSSKDYNKIIANQLEKDKLKESTSFGDRGACR